jgi:hypothetical protein
MSEDKVAAVVRMFAALPRESQERAFADAIEIYAARHMAGDAAGQQALYEEVENLRQLSSCHDSRLH